MRIPPGDAPATPAASSASNVTSRAAAATQSTSFMQILLSRSKGRRIARTRLPVRYVAPNIALLLCEM